MIQIQAVEGGIEISPDQSSAASYFTNEAPQSSISVWDTEYICTDYEAYDNL